MYLEQDKDNLATAMTLQQKDYQTCLNNLNRQNNKSTETSNNYQVVQGTKSSNRKLDEGNTPSTYVLNTENQYQSLSDILDGETPTETRIYNHPKGNEKNESHEIGSDVIIIGDSIVKNIQPRKLTRKKVHKYTFPGKTADEIEKEINFDNLKSIPSHVIIHVGTNNLPLESATECAQKIEKLAKKTKTQFPYSKIGLSGLTVRHDIAMLEKIQEVNKKIGHICKKLEISFIDNSTIDDTCLTVSSI